MPAETSVQSLKSLAHGWHHTAHWYARGTPQQHGASTCHSMHARALKSWRRQRDAECAVSRLLDDGRPRFERRFGSSTWTVGGAS